MIDEGRFLSHHGFAKTNSWIAIIISLFLMLAGAILLLLLLLADKPDEQVVQLTLLAGMTCIVSGILFLFLRQYIKPSQVYELHENGVLVINQHDHKDRFIPFEKISDIYLYRAGKYAGRLKHAMAFRTDIYNQWNKISPNVSGAKRLIKAIIDQQLLQRGPASLNRLANDGHISFFYRTEGRLKCLLMRNFFMMNEKQLRLSALSLTTENVAISIEEIHTIKGSESEQTIQLLDVQGKVLFSIPYLSLFSADLFIALIEHMIESRIPIRT